MLLIQNGRVLDPASKTDAAMDVLLDGEIIKEIAAPGNSLRSKMRRSSTPRDSSWHQVL